MRRPLFFVLIGLIISSAAVAQTEMPAPTVCALREPEAPHPRGHGTVLGIQDAAVARANIPRREAQRGGAIDPRYLNDLRAVVKQDNGIIDTFDVPSGTAVHVGDRVRLQGSYRSTSYTCSYIPHMAIPNDAPAA
jgi:hypothetical protein